MSGPERQPHALLDLTSRRHKAMKIERLLGLADRPQPMRLLEIGTGSGGIAHYFATHATLRCEVDAVDVCDNRRVYDGYHYQTVQGVQLPFADASFDVVITNHVIEHVGDMAAQCRHLAQVRRVLKPNGIGYLAVPNRWMLTEPHYRLKFLSWLPKKWRTPYLRFMHKGEFYDCEPLQMRQLERMLTAAGLNYCNLSVAALRATVAIEPESFPLARAIGVFPDGLLHALDRVFPTLVYRLEQADKEQAGKERA